MQSKVLIIGLAGGSGSGKTTVTNDIIKEIGTENVEIIEQDAYYADFPNLPLAERKKRNFDHPDAFDTPLLVKHIKLLKQGKAVHKPVYNFVTHLRNKESILVKPKKVLIIEGILIFYYEELRNLLDIMIFVDTESDVRLIRRIRRDMLERGRSLDSILQQYENTVRPMHKKFIEPTRRHAHIILPEGSNRIAIEFIIERIKKAIIING